jgi:hypothetical protein
LTADGEKDKAWGNETIRWHPDQGWLEIKLPAPLAGLANRPHGRYRLCAAVEFAYRGDEVAAQAATGAVRYDISRDPASGRWYIDASWRTVPAPAPPRRRRHGQPPRGPANPGSPGRIKDARHPTRPPAATRRQDRQASPEHGRQPGSPRPFGAAG